MTLKCDECGQEAPFVKYIGSKKYCYSCFYEVKRQEAKEYNMRISAETLRIKNAYRRGYKPSEIAKKMNMSVAEIYKRLNEMGGENEDDR